MRNLNQWCQKLCKDLRDSSELKDYVALRFEEAEPNVQKREVSRLARSIADVELGLTLLREVAPEDPATSVEGLLKGYRFPLACLQDETNWQMVQKARFYLVRRKGRQWERSLSEYVQIPEVLRIYNLQHSSDVPQIVPSSTFPHRLEEVYRPTLLRTPPHQKREVNLATQGRWFCKIVQNGNSPVEIPIDIPEIVANLAPSPSVSFWRSRQAKNPSKSVTIEQLLVSAREMDAKLVEPKYAKVLESLTLQLYDEMSEDFHPGTELSLDRIIHIVGLLNVGKSTLLEILIYHLAKQNYRCALIVNDVVAAVRIASLFWHVLGIPAAPILGSDRAEQLEKVYESILADRGEEITRGGVHPAWRWFSSVCPLLALVRSPERWEYGQEPCHKLYQKLAKSDGNSQAEEEELEEDDDKYTCPLYYACPRHQLEKDIATALVWVLTPASFIHTRVPRQIFAEHLTFAEAVYRECEFLFVDEADRVQIQFDEAFVPDEALVDASGNSLLNKIGLNAATIYNSERSNMAADRLVTWTSAQYNAQDATNRLYHLFLTQPQLAEWLGKNPFTGRSLFARIVREIVNLNPDNNPIAQKPKPSRQARMEEQRRQIVEESSSVENRRRRQELMGSLQPFLQSPLNRRLGGELADLALTILKSESDREAFEEIRGWCERWLATHQIVFTPTQLEELVKNVHFAILTTVLDDRLGFLIDRLGEIQQVLDLHDLSQSLVHRPPRDYLPVIPESPVGNILGFRYIRDRRNLKKAGKLEYFRYVGLGRALLLNFPTLFAVDEWDGPHTVLISGTSYAPGSPAYHIRIQPTVLLENIANTGGCRGDSGIGESQFYCSPQRSDRENFIALSGLSAAQRKNAAEELARAISKPIGNVPCLLDEIFQELRQKAEEIPEWWGDRQRLLIVVGSYEESLHVTSRLQLMYRFNAANTDEIDGIVTLVRDNAPVQTRGMRRGQIHTLKDTPTQIVVAPLMALERGHNILNEEKKAAFGAALFLNRPMPVPDDWQSTVRQLNAWALENEANSQFYEILQSKGEPLTVSNVADCFYRNAVAEMLNLNFTAWSFQQLTDDERHVLCWTQLVSIWQIIGRLVRGNVPAIVHFVDVKFAPNSAISEKDRETTSLLVGMVKVLEIAIQYEIQKPYERTLARSLYELFLNALKNTQGLHYDISNNSTQRLGTN